MKTKLTVIVDNIPQGEKKGEWGLSILAEYANKKILVDVGGSNLFAENLEKLGFDISEIDYATLSHAHYDHANGMARFFQKNERAQFFLREGTRENCYFKKFIFHKYIGLPKNILQDYKERIAFADGKYELFPGAYLIPHSTPNLEKIGKREMMYQRTEQGFVPDNFSHEQSLVLETDKGLLIINCCSHGGVVNIINEVQREFPGQKVYGYIGGMHLFNKSNKEVRMVATKIRETGIDYVCTGHCTKERAYGILKQELGDKLEQLHVGLCMEF